jgi:hypothetical protein
MARRARVRRRANCRTARSAPSARPFLAPPLSPSPDAPSRASRRRGGARQPSSAPIGSIYTASRSPTTSAALTKGWVIHHKQMRTAMQTTAARAGLTCAHGAACRGHTNASAARSTLFHAKPARAVRHPVASGPIRRAKGTHRGLSRTGGAVRTLSIHVIDARRVFPRSRAAWRRAVHTGLRVWWARRGARRQCDVACVPGCSRSHRVAIGLFHAPASAAAGDQVAGDTWLVLRCGALARGVLF